MSNNTDSNKTVLVTGASSGIGKETAKTLANKGFTVYAAARRLDAMDKLKDHGVIPLKMDITKEDDVVAVVERIERERGGIDILVNNAGFGTQGSVEETTLADARYQFEVNLFGLARLTQLVLPHMRAQKFGKIINVSSAGGKLYAPMNAWYIGSKHALEGWSDCLRVETRDFGIQVVIVEPGAIATEFDEVYVTPMLERSGNGPYAKAANAVAKFSHDMQGRPNGASPPSVIADVILRAVTTRRPQTRYVAGKLAKPMLFVRKWGGDRFYDWALGQLFR